MAALGLSQDFKEFLALLNANKVEYLLVGGYAVAAHGHPRYTKDLDIWVATAPDNAQAILCSIKQFGFSEVPLSIEDLLQPEQVIQLGYEPARIDLLTTLSGVEFADCKKNAINIEVDGTHVPLISLQDLEDNKRATGRLRDLADLEDLGIAVKLRE